MVRSRYQDRRVSSRDHQTPDPGLASKIADEHERLEHILRNMARGRHNGAHVIDIPTHAVLLEARHGPHAVVTMPSDAGNIWFDRVEHSYANGRCPECSASQEQMERENRENYAYGFIHAAGRAAIEKEFGMKFDVIVGNPPYQMDSAGQNRTCRSTTCSSSKRKRSTLDTSR